jgi:ribosomal protein L16 Arg81 hydroxylase
MKAWSLEALIDPVSKEDFFNAHFELQRLLVRRNKPDHFEDLLTLDDVDRLLTTVHSTREDVAVVNAADKVNVSDYVSSGGKVSVDQVLRLHEAGGTIILNHLHRRHPPLANLCAALELEFSAPFQTNVYLTPARAQGFHPHFDTHDVLVLQIAGSKRWQLYGTPVDLALKGHGAHARQDEPGPVNEEFDLRAGDTLYLPRGLVHEAISTDEASLHITVGALSWTWFDFLLEAVERLAASDRQVRSALPAAFARADCNRVDFNKTFAELARRLATDVDADEIRKSFAERFIDRRPQFLRHQMKALTHIGEIGLDSIVGRRPFLAYLLDEDEQYLTLRFHHHEITLPLHAGPALRHALAAERFKVRDLPGNLDDAGKLVLVRRLIREGLVQPLEQPG